MVERVEALMPRKKNTFDCSEVEDKNPTRLLQESYQELMKIDDLVQLKSRTTKIVEGSSVSRKNLIKFQRDREKIGSLGEFQKYVTNYILAGSGMGTRFER